MLPKVEDEAEFCRIPVGRRIVFSLGGPVANFISAGVLLGIGHALTEGLSAYGVLVWPWREVVVQSGAFLAALPAIFTHPDQLSGVVGIVAIGKTVVDSGLLSALRFAVLLDLNLAIFNLLPIAPLDGGKIVCAILEKIHPRLARLQTGFSVAGLGLLLLLMLYTTVLDVWRQLA